MRTCLAIVAAAALGGCAHNNEEMQATPTNQGYTQPSQNLQQPTSQVNPQLQPGMENQGQIVTGQMDQTSPTIDQSNQNLYSRESMEPVAGRDSISIRDESGSTRQVSDPILIARLQQKLSDKGCNPGRTDGKVDSQLSTALMQCQLKLGLPQSGVVDQKTANALGLDWSSFQKPAATPPMNQP